MSDDLQNGLQSVIALPEFSVQHLLKQFEVSKPTLYSYFDALSIKPVRMGRAAYISEADCDKLQQLTIVLRQTKSMTISEAVRQLRASGVIIARSVKELEADLEPQVQRIVRQGVNSSGLTSSEEYEAPALSAIQSFLTPSNSPTVKGVIRMGRSILGPLSSGINRIAKSIDNGVAVFSKANPLDPLKPHKVLKEAADLEFALPSSKLAEILELDSLPSGRSFQRIGYQFTKVGKSGREALWGVRKLSYEIDLAQD